MRPALSVHEETGMRLLGNGPISAGADFSDQLWKMLPESERKRWTDSGNHSSTLGLRVLNRLNQLGLIEHVGQFWKLTGPGREWFGVAVVGVSYRVEVTGEQAYGVLVAQSPLDDSSKIIAVWMMDRWQLTDDGRLMVEGQLSVPEPREMQPGDKVQMRIPLDKFELARTAPPKPLAGTAFCVQCGKPLEEAWVSCPHCGLKRYKEAGPAPLV